MTTRDVDGGKYQKFEQNDDVERGLLMQVGSEIYVVYGSETAGWSLGGRDPQSFVPPAFRYESLEELFFALVNFTNAPEGQA